MNKEDKDFISTIFFIIAILIGLKTDDEKRKKW